MILLIDNYDSFVYNLARYFERLGHSTRVVRNTAIDLAGVKSLRPSAIVLSPGPCTPDRAGCSPELVRTLHAELPILGVWIHGRYPALGMITQGVGAGVSALRSAGSLDRGCP